MRTIRAAKLFQIILGPGQIRHGRAGKESGPVTPGALPEGHQGRGKRPCGSQVSRHRPQEAPEATRHGQGLALVLIPKDMGRPMDPVRPRTDVGPQLSRVDQAALKQGLQPAQLLGQGPLFAPCSRLAAIALRRSGSLSPEASRGGRPSSVRALRTAAQEPRTTSASGSRRPARRRAMGRTPRPRFFSAFLAWRSAS
jgi:hypothetical protein